MRSWRGPLAAALAVLILGVVAWLVAPLDAPEVVEPVPRPRPPRDVGVARLEVVGVARGFTADEAMVWLVMVENQGGGPAARPEVTVELLDAEGEALGEVHGVSELGALSPGDRVVILVEAHPDAEFARDRVTADTVQLDGPPARALPIRGVTGEGTVVRGTVSNPGGAPTGGTIVAVGMAKDGFAVAWGKVDLEDPLPPGGSYDFAVDTAPYKLGAVERWGAYAVAR